MTHFGTAPAWPQSRSEVETAGDERLLEFMECCAVEPADFEACLACYAYEVLQLRWRQAVADALRD